MQILIVAPSWIGDALLAQPLFRLLHKRHPNAALDALAPAWTGPVLGRMPEIRHIITSPFSHGELPLGARRRMPPQLSETGYDQAIVLPNSFKSALIPWLAGIPLRTGYRGEHRYGLLNDMRRLDARAMPQLAQRYAALAAPRGAPLPEFEPQGMLLTDEHQRRNVLQKLGLDETRPVVALCPGAEYGPAKQWPARHFAQLAHLLAKEGYAVWLVGSGKDAAVGSEITALADSHCINLCGRTTLEDAIDLLASAHAVVSNDSGLMHVAAALGRPLVALYGSSTPSYTPPLSRQAVVLTLALPCSPCFKRVCPLGHFRCLQDLEPAQVLAALRFDRILPKPE